MHIPSEVLAIEGRLKAAGVPVQSLLEAAEVDRSTWTRWKSGSFQPRLSKWFDVAAAAERLLDKPEAA